MAGPAMSAQSSAAKQLQMNQALRALLLQSAPRMRKDLGVTTGTLGQTSRIQIFNVGLLTSLQAAVSCPVTIGAANATPSPRAPYNLINRVRLTDYDGTDRVNWSGFQLFVLNCVRSRIPYGVNNEGPIVTAQGSSVLGGIITNPSTPTQVGNGTIAFLLDIPVAYDPEADLRGMILAQTAVGTMYLSIDWNANLISGGAGSGTANVDSVYNGAATSTVVMQAGVTGPSIQIWQEYLMPQAINGQLPLPMIDLQTVYEMAGNLRDNSNLAQNVEKLLNYPNVRSVIGGYFNYINGVNSMLSTDITRFRLIANGNNILRDDTLFSQQIRQRNYLEGDIAFGTYFYLHRSKPVETALFGNVQAGITPNLVNAAALIEFGYESFYTKGSALPGISQ
jgi:hypothetical protein